jgi:8-oxo-dGTP pyrophosphatase MutT (NUDIX family)
MSLDTYFRYIEACNSFEPADFLPFFVAGRQIGQIPARYADALAGRPQLQRQGDGFALIAADSFEARSDALDALVGDLIPAGLPLRRRKEKFPLVSTWGEEPLAALDRGAVTFFGIKAFGIHINVFVRTPTGLDMWLGRRSRTKPVAPGQLDNLVAGGQPHGLTLIENVAKEADEEAGIPAAVIKGVRPVGAVSYHMASEGGSRDDVLFLYDLEVDEAFKPVSHDDEHEAFLRLPVEQVTKLLQSPVAFKFNVTLVLVDFLVRHGYIAADTPGYLELVKGLRR